MRPHVLTLLILCLLGLLLYGKTFDDPFHFDDFHVFVDLSVADQTVRCHDLNRLIPHLSFLANHLLHGLHPEGYHAFNLWVHIATAYAVYFLLTGLLPAGPPGEQHGRERGHKSGHDSDRGIGLQETAAIIGAVLFLAHPLATQAVAYISQRYTSLATLFYVSAAALYAHARRCECSESGATAAPRCAFMHLLAILAAVGAMLSKEMTITLPVTILVMEFMIIEPRPEQWQRRLARLAPMLLTGLIVPWLQLGGSTIFSDAGSATFLPSVETMEEFKPLGDWAPAHFSRSSYLYTQLNVIVTVYLRLLLIPVGQSIDHAFTIAYGFWNARTVYSAMVLAAIVGVGLSAWRRLPLVGFALLWLFLTLLPTSSIVPNTEFVAEHRMYLPLVSLAMIAAALYQWLPQPSRIKALAFGLAVVVCCAMTWRRNTVWATDIALWQDAVRKSPDKARPHYALGTAYEKIGDLAAASACYREAIRCHPQYALAWNNLGNIDYYEGRLDRAAACYRKALQNDPNYADAWYNLSLVYNKLDQLQEALAANLRALQCRPRYPEAHYNLGMIYDRLSQRENAILAYEAVVDQRPDFTPAHVALAGLYGQLGRLTEAVMAYRRVIDLQPGRISAYLELAAIHQDIGQFADAAAVLQRALDLQPSGSALFYYRLGVNYRLRGELAAALAEQNRAIAAQPDIAAFHYELAQIYDLLGENAKAAASLQRVVALDSRVDAMIRPYLADSAISGANRNLRPLFKAIPALPAHPSVVEESGD